MRTKNLNKLYNDDLIEFNQTGRHPHPAKLLALLLLPEKDNFFPMKTSSGEFYKFYKLEIDAKINQVIKDFHITKEEIIKYIEEQGICFSEENYEYNKIWFVFCNGFNALHWGILYHPNWHPEKIYSECSVYWDDKPVKHESRKKKKERKKRQLKYK